MRTFPGYLALILGASFAVTGWTQEADTTSDADADAETQAEESSTEGSSDEELPTEELSAEEIEVDDGSYLDADDEDFRPSVPLPAPMPAASPRKRTSRFSESQARSSLRNCSASGG